MKTSLTQAWEATGFTGYALREKVHFELGNRFHKENPDWQKYWSRVFSGIMGMLMVFGLFGVWIQIVAPMLPTDLSQSIVMLLFICAVVIPSVSAVIAATLLYLSVGKNFQKAIKCPSVSRYIFQHRDDEVEL